MKHSHRTCGTIFGWLRPGTVLAIVLLGTLSPTHIRPAFGQCDTWRPLGLGMNDAVRALTVYNGELIAGGWFTGVDNSDNRSMSRIARWNGFVWQSLGSGIGPWVVYALTVYNGELIAAGDFDNAGGQSASNIARWNGSIWQPLGSGTNNDVRALAVFDGDLIAGGTFTLAGGLPTARIARWDGSAWHSLGASHDTTEEFAIYDGELVAASSFDVPLSDQWGLHIGRWRRNWQTLGSECNGVSALIVYDDELIAAGVFNIAGQQHRMARWSGSVWQPFEAIQSGHGIADLITYHGDLIASGWFSLPNISVPLIARWNGVEWSLFGGSIVGSESAGITALVVYNDELIAAGQFTSASGMPALNIARWVDCPENPCPSDLNGDNSVNVHDHRRLGWMRCALSAMV